MYEVSFRKSRGHFVLKIMYKSKFSKGEGGVVDLGESLLAEFIECKFVNNQNIAHNGGVSNV